jgi:OOP family OmpA-OmpF porin
MKTSNKLCILSAAVVSTLTAGTAFAQDSGNYYGGLSYGQTRAKIDEQRITNLILGSRASSFALSSDNKDVGYKAFLGYQMTPGIALEAGYVNLGKFRWSAPTVPAGSFNGQVRVQGASLDLVGRAPVTDNLSLIGRIGATYAKTRDSFSGTGVVSGLIGDASPRSRKVNYKAGVGVQYALSPAVLVRVEGERYRIDDAMGDKGHINLYSAGLVFPFGGTRRAVSQVASNSTYIAPAPAAAPIAPPPETIAPVAAAPVAPLPPPRQRVTFSAESLFAFDRAVVRPEGKLALDKFASDIRGTRFDTITVEGHTDRLGSVAYNQKLSDSRAAAVRDYLVTSGQLDQSKITAVGKSESVPVTKAEDCKGNTPSKRLIACLQPDRRVDVEVVGTR